MAVAKQQAAVQPRLDEVCQQISAVEAAALLGISRKTLTHWMSAQQVADTQWRWVNGEIYFQVARNGSIVFNKYLLSMWQIAKAQDDAMIYRNAIARFRSAVNP
jgi:hypothetical protein